MAARGAGAAAGDAGDRVSRHVTSPDVSRIVCVHSARASKTPVTSRARTSRSNTAGPTIKPIDCRRWPPNWSADGRGDRRARSPAASRRQGGNHDDPNRLPRAQDPVALGLCRSLARPGGNLTGINFLDRAGGKAAGVPAQLVPVITRVAVLVNPTNPWPPKQTLRAWSSPGRILGLQVDGSNASNIAKSIAAFAGFAQDAPMPLRQKLPFLTSALQFALLAMRSRSCPYYPWRDYAEVGGLMSYGSNLPMQS